MLNLLGDYEENGDIVQSTYPVLLLCLQITKQMEQPDTPTTTPTSITIME